MQSIGRSKRNKDSESKSNGCSLRRFSKVKSFPYFRAKVCERDHDEGIDKNLPVTEVGKTLFYQFLFPPFGTLKLLTEYFRLYFTNAGNRHLGVLGDG